MDEEIELELRHGTWWDRFNETNRTSWPTFLQMVIDEDTAFFIDQLGMVVPPSTIKKTIKLLQNYVDSQQDKDILARNLEYLLEQSRVKNQPAERTRTQSGYVYVVRCGNKLKCGRTKNTANRFSQYKKTSDIFKEIISKAVPDYIAAEKQLLAHMGGEVGRAEWFDYSIDVENKAREFVCGLVAV